MYRYVDAAVLRAAAHPDLWSLPPWPDLADGGRGDVEQWRRWLTHVLADGHLAEAVEIASPPLADAVRAVCEGRTVRVRQVRRTVLSVVRYLLRARHRATPFGTFAGIAPARFGSTLTARWGNQHQAVAHPDAVWLADIIARLEACPELLRRLPVMADSTAFIRGSSLVVPCQQPAHGSSAALASSAEVSVRYTRAVETATQAAQSPILVGDLAGKLAVDYPDATADVIGRLLSDLVGLRILLTSLRPPMTATDALGHVIDQLAAAHADSISDVAPTVQELRQIHCTLTEHNHAIPDARRKSRAQLAGQMTALSATTRQPLAVDLRLDADLILPDHVGREAATAVHTLARLSPFPSGSPAWQDYHARFLERYGPGALVPVRELTNPNTGLGLPAGYRGSLRERPHPRPGLRDDHLLTLVQQATMDRADEITLDEQTIDALSPQQLPQVPAHAQLCFRLHAPTRTALVDGLFDLVIVGLTPGAGTTTGRFLDLFDIPDRERVATTYAALPTLTSGAALAQITGPPLRTRTENVARTPETLPTVIPLAEHNDSPRTLPLGDLAVSADVQGLYLVSLSTERTIEPALLNAVQLTNFTHPLARFLCEIPRARAAVLGPFSWGAASRMPFLPRVRYGRTVLAEACWRLRASNLPGPAAPWDQWAEALAVWRDRFRLPATVQLGGDDQRLHLDLGEQAHLHLLRAHLEKTDHATLHEAPDSSAYGWLDGRAHEISLALATTQTTAPAPRRPVSPDVIGRDHGHLLGASEWAFAKLYTHPDRIPDILTTHLPGLLNTWDTPPQWWYVPYRDPEPHLRLRIHLTHPDDYAETVRRVGVWAADLRRLGLAGRVQWDTYDPETGRYGIDRAMDAAHEVFAADSAAAIAQLRIPRTSQPAITAASFIDLAAAIIGSTTDGMHWLTHHLPKPSGPPLARALENEAMRLADPSTDFTALRALPGGQDAYEAWKRRRAALDAYRHQLTTADGPTAVLPSLLHMHHIRVTGINEECERTCRRLARAAALSWTARGVTP
ncbi:lantibiotic dehydratase [Streptomyces sp. NPDC053474]|uniref:lantibiotic dehydratase n=1 Tax=Streptomyces sp. NPDC053474 TaxID=3365704 RepID=UPI0037D20333